MLHILVQYVRPATERVRVFSMPTSQPLIRSALLLVVSILVLGCQHIPGTIPVTETPALGQTRSSASTAPATTIAAPAPTPSAAPSPSTAVAAVPSPLPTPSGNNQPLASIASLDAVPLPPRDPIELAYQFGRVASKQRIVHTAPLQVRVGDKQLFTITNPGAAIDDPERNYTVNATLVLMLEHVLIYLQDGLDVDMAELERSSRAFNDATYPRTRELFGSEWQPGIDGDPRLTILNARIAGIGGFFSVNDELPRSVSRFSNEREMFYINLDSAPPGTDAYGSTLAHEFQHMIQWNETQRTTTWLNEGLSQLAQELNGFVDDPTGGPFAFLVNPDLQLTDWGNTPQESIQNYGASYLFMSYFYQHYGDPAALRRLIKAGAGRQLNIFADIARQRHPALADFAELYADWSVANLLNDPRLEGGRYAYRQLPEPVQPVSLAPATADTVAQFGADYWTVPASSQERVLRFDGSDTIAVVAAQPEGRAMWWSNRGDNTHMTLTRTVDLRGVSSATLQFRLWFDLEQGWDYGFVTVSTDEGRHWTTLPGRYTTADNPQDANFGHGYTGQSGVEASLLGEQASSDLPAWLDEQIDLTPYAGKQILLRFSVVNDQGTNRSGMALDTIRIPEIGLNEGAEMSDGGWDAQGFVRTNNQLDQLWQVRLVRANGPTISVEPLKLDAQRRGEYRIGPDEQATVIVMATTPYTTERAAYKLNLTRR